MNLIIDKLLVFLCCTTLITLIPITTSTVVYILLAITVSCFCSCFDNKIVCTTLVGLYIIICIIKPEFLIYIPLMLYDVSAKQLKLCYLLSIIAVFKYIIYTNSIIILFIAVFCIVSLVLQSKTCTLNCLQNEFKLLRDTSTEYSLLLSAKNKDLMDMQDYEVHVATLNERNRIAREIHDNVGHILSRSILQLGAIMTISKDENLHTSLEMLKNTLNKAMNSIRESVHDLHDDSIDLYSSVNEILKDFKDYNVNFEYDMTDVVSKAIKYCFISITKEALSNITRHSNASKIHISFYEHPGLYQLMIYDDGNTYNNNDPGIGLINMKERVEALNGTFRVDYSNGFKIFVSIPIKSK